MLAAAMLVHVDALHAHPSLAEANQVAMIELGIADTAFIVIAAIGAAEVAIDEAIFFESEFTMITADIGSGTSTGQS